MSQESKVTLAIAALAEALVEELRKEHEDIQDAHDVQAYLDEVQIEDFVTELVLEQLGLDQ